MDVRNERKARGKNTRQVKDREKDCGFALHLGHSCFLSSCDSHETPGWGGGVEVGKRVEGGEVAPPCWSSLLL